ncbi:phasin family protein [Pseudomonas sp. SWRI92]|uniref:phasin family protein n=1 Tax=Pseudomonas sp. SWRI92 TaxID=2745499 RepID=UPI0016496917|nr:phasin family protein [Pseudomonas sp. SWRI92]MBC3376043.1 phasin family protein [Pseudomonas sp. SWRI92]
MAGKKITEKEGSSWAGKIEKYSRKIWLAGLGVYSKIDTDGSKLFESLVKDGEKAEKLTKTAVGKQVDAATVSAESAKSRIGGVKDRALGKWDELEGAFDKRLNSAISRLGVPSRNEVKELHSKVDTLTKQIEKLTGAKVTPVATKATASKTAAAKPAAKTAAKPLVKAAAKTVAKPAAKAAAKPAAKAAAKTAAAKPAAKAAAKPVAAKAAAKPAAKTAAAKPAAAKPAAKAAAKPAAKPAAAKKPAVKKATAPKAAAPKAPTATAKPATPTSTANSASAPTPVATPTPAPAPLTPTSQS